MGILAEHVIQFRAVGATATQQAIASVTRSLSGLSGSVGTMGRLFGMAIAPVRSLGGVLSSVLSPANILQGIGLGLGQSIFNSFTSAVASAMQLAASVETLAVSFRVLLGSEEKAAQLLQQINRFAAETPFEQMELAEVAKQLLAYGVSADEVMGVMRRLGDIAALSGARLEDLAAVYGKVRAQGRLTAETLESWQARGIPITRELAAMFGVAESQVRELVSEGRVGFAEVQEAIRRLTSAGGQFAGGMQQLSRTAAGLWSTVTGNFKTFLAELGAGIMESLRVKEALAAVGTWLGKAAGSIREVLAPVGETVSAVIARIVTVSQELWTRWREVFMQMWHTTASVITAIGEIVSSTVSGLWKSVIQPVFATIGGYMVNVLQSLAAGWRWLFGVTGEMTGNWLQDWLLSVQFVAENWRLGLQIMWESVKTFFTNLPAYWRAVIQNLINVAIWFGRNWREILLDSLNYFLTVAQNAFTNLKNLAASVWDFMRTGKWELDWTPLTEGFESAIKELPQFVAPDVQTAALDQLLDEWHRRWEDFRERQARSAAAVAASAPEAPTIPETPALPAGPAPPTPAAAPAGPGTEAAARFVGFAELARQMQQDVAREMQKRTAEAAKRTADATEKLAQAVHGGALRVRVEEPVSASYA